MFFTDLLEVKSELAIDLGDTSEDKNLMFYIEQGSSIIEDYLGRGKYTDLRERTEYYDGTGTQQLLLRSRPVRTTPTIQCYVDTQGFYGQDSDSFSSSGDQLTYGDDFVLKIDQPDGTSRSGILVRRNSYWTRPMVRTPGLLSPFVGKGFGNIKVVYSGGYMIQELPASFRFAANLLVAKMRYIMPLGVELGGESYEDRNISLQPEQKAYLLGLVKPILHQYRNRKW